MRRVRKILSPAVSNAMMDAQVFEHGATSLQFQKIFQEIDHGFIILDVNNRIVFANDAFCAMLKLTARKRKYLLNKEITDFYTPETRTCFFDYIREALEKKQTWAGEIDFITQAKNIVRTSCEIVPIASTNKNGIFYVYWVSQLVGGKVLLCPNLEETVGFLKSLFELAPNPIYLINYQGRILNANNSFSKVTGYANQELLNKTIYDLEGTVASKRQLTELLNQSDKKANVAFQSKLIAKSGLICTAEFTLKKVMLCGKPAILVYMQDVSLRKKYQEEARYNFELRNLLTKVTNRFSLVSINSFDKAANQALGDLGKFARVDRCYLFKVKNNELFLAGGTEWRLKHPARINQVFMANTHEWCSSYAKSVIENLQHIPLTPYMWILEYFRQYNCLAIDSVEDLPNEFAQAKKEFMREGIKSMLVVPLKRGKNIFGTVGFDAVVNRVKWNPIIIQLLTDFSNFIAQALDRRETLILQEQKKKLELTFTKKLLSATEEELEFFIKYVPSPIAILNRDLRCVAVSERWQQEFSVKNKVVIGEMYDEIFGKDALKWGKICRQCLQGNMLANDKDDFVRVDGKHEWIKWKAYPRKDQDNNISGVIILAEVITERIIYEEKILHMTRYDMLTDLPNRNYFREVVTEILEKQKGRKYSLLIVSINNLEAINNYYNIFVGDLFIQEVAIRIKSCLSKDTFMARFDGGQFVLVFRKANKNEITNLVNKLNASVAQIFHIQNYTIRTSFSFGVRSFCTDGLGYEQLIKDAEIALSHAKLVAAEKIAFFDAALEKKYLRRVLLENDLQQALDASQFYLVYQPYFSLQDGCIAGMEALVRWRHPKLKEISPVEFIPLAEKTGKIIELGYWILHTSFSDIKALMKKRKNHNQINYSINLSPEQLLDPKFFKKLKKMIAAYAIPTEVLQFEITETKLLQNIENVIVVLEQIKKIGCKIAIDDFGTGHSSLERLRELPVSVIKIDKCFVDNVDTNEKSTSLVKHILMLANELGLKTIAEGIENAGQEHMLKFLGCNIGQGFYYSQPILLTKLEKKYLSNGVAKI